MTYTDAVKQYVINAKRLQEACTLFNGLPDNIASKEQKNLFRIASEIGTTDNPKYPNTARLLRIIGRHIEKSNETDEDNMYVKMELRQIQEIIKTCHYNTIGEACLLLSYAATAAGYIHVLEPPATPKKRLMDLLTQIDVAKEALYDEHLSSAQKAKDVTEAIIRCCEFRVDMEHADSKIPNTIIEKMDEIQDCLGYANLLIQTAL